MKRSTMLAALSAVLATTSGLAQAGDVLRLKASGVVRAADLPRLNPIGAAAGTELFLIQWKSNVKESEKAELAKLGLQLLSYIPDDAFLFQGTHGQALAAARLGFVRSVSPFVPSLKVEPELTRHGMFSFTDAARVTIQLAPSADQAAVRGLLENSLDVGDGIIVGDSSVGALWQLAARSDVLWIERFFPMRPMDLKPAELGVTLVARDGISQTGYESGTKVLNVDSFYKAGLNGQGQVVAVADTGLDTGDLTTISADFQGQVKSGLAIGLGGHSWGDPEMHGTHVSGSILGNGQASGGLIRGGAFGAKLVMLGMWSDIMNNIMPPSIPKILDAGYNEGARIQSNSWGAPNSAGRYDTWAMLTDTWLFDHPDYLAMFAAGNDGADLDHDGVVDENTVSSPGSAKNVLTVGASKNLLLEGGIQKQMKDLRNGSTKWSVEPLASSRLSDDIRGMAAFSSRGPTADGRIKPEIVAPGTNIVSARDKHPKADPATMSWGIYDDSYVYMGGTSMSTPVAAGALALTRQYLLQKLGTESVSSALLKATAANMAEDLYPGQFGERSSGQEQPSRRPNNHEGWGRVNMENLIQDQGVQLVDERAGLATGESKTFTARVADGRKALRVTLAYTDAPGAASAQRTLVNDLDVTVSDASGRIFYPNGRSDKDSVNNMEEIDLLNPAVGSYQVVVTGANVPQGKNGRQPYALVISAGH